MSYVKLLRTAAEGRVVLFNEVPANFILRWRTLGVVTCSRSDGGCSSSIWNRWSIVVRTGWHCNVCRIVGRLTRKATVYGLNWHFSSHFLWSDAQFSIREQGTNGMLRAPLELMK